ncbi:MAG: hypothetical protein ACT4QF_16620 [Sporichthyaceae bacterium]
MSLSSTGRRRPGDPPHLFAAAIPSALGILLVVLGWVAVSGEAAFDDQGVGLNLAIAGAMLVGIGCGFYLWMFRRRIARRLATCKDRYGLGGEQD